MSVTFWCPGAPTVSVTPYEDEPDYVEQQSTLPEINLANANARAALEMLGLDGQNEDLCGTLRVAQLDPCIERVKRFIGNSVDRASFLEPTVVNGQVAVEQPLEQPQLVLDMEAGAVAADAPAPHPRAGLHSMLGLDQSPVLPGPGRSLGALLQERIRGSARMVSFGRDDEYLVRTAKRFLDLFQQAKEHGHDISWG